jgi:glycosyltransferase involved in cell wall biosynthesis
MTAPVVSIVTPSLNQAQFIRATIDSVLGQDYSALEYWVMDGGSTDGTLEILRGYGERLNWVSEPDEGQAAAINKGWRLARGEIIAYLNADDVYLPGAIDRVVNFFSAHPGVDIVYGDCDYVDAAGRFLQAYPTRAYDYVDLVRSTIDYIPQPAVFLRRRVLESVGCLDERLSFAMDFDYWLRAGLSCAFAYLPARLAALRVHHGAKSVSHLKGFAGELVTIYHRLFSRDDLPDSVRAIQSQAMSNIYYRAASCAFWSGQDAGARRYALQAWRYRPLNLRLPLALAFSGAWGREILMHWFGNPFLLRR